MSPPVVQASGLVPMLATLGSITLPQRLAVPVTALVVVALAGVVAGLAAGALPPRRSRRTRLDGPGALARD